MASSIRSMRRFNLWLAVNAIETFGEPLLRARREGWTKRKRQKYLAQH